MNKTVLAVGFCCNQQAFCLDFVAFGSGARVQMFTRQLYRIHFNTCDKPSVV